MNLLQNYINGAWVNSGGTESINVVNPATQEVLAKVPYGNETQKDVADAVIAAQAAYLEWKNVPVLKRIQPLFKLKQLLEENRDEIARLITLECGKTLAESSGELQRAIENVEVACGAPMLMQSEFLENVATGIDEFMIRQPLGVTACIAPFNFPAMISFWFLPYAIATGNSMIIKPSEKVPLTMMKIFELLHQLDLPKGVINMVHGGKASVDELLENSLVKSISFVGSTAVAKYIYSKGTANGKRVQAQGGAKNPVVVLPDADIEMGPVINNDSKVRIESLIDQGVAEGGSLLLDGRNKKIGGFETGNFVSPTIIENLSLNGELIKTEIFGPVMSLLHMKTVEDAIAFINQNRYGNMACLFTNSGSSARKFRSEAMAGNIGINIGIAAPMAQFPFSGWNESFFGDLHGQGKHAIEFFTQTKVVVERWPKEWTRKF